MFTMNVGQGQWPGSGAASVSKAALARVPSAPPTKTAASSRPSKLNMSQSIAVQLSLGRTTRFSEEQNRGMAANPRAGQPAHPEDLIDVAQVVTAYYTVEPDPDNVDQQVAFGTSGHRGSSLDAAFNEAHILATTKAIVEYRAGQGTTGPLFIGRDTHALSEPAWASALEVLAANDVVAMIDSADRYTPTPAVSHAILTFNRGRDGDLADGIVVTPPHNPPRDGRLKDKPPKPGPADTDATGAIAKRANEILREGLKAVKRVPLARALQTAQRHDYMDAYVEDLPNVVDIHAIRAEGIRIGADPLGGASVDYWGAIGEAHKIELNVVHPLGGAT